MKLLTLLFIIALAGCKATEKPPVLVGKTYYCFEDNKLVNGTDSIAIPKGKYKKGHYYFIYR